LLFEIVAHQVVTRAEFGSGPINGGGNLHSGGDPGAKQYQHGAGCRAAQPWSSNVIMPLRRRAVAQFRPAGRRIGRDRRHPAASAFESPPPGQADA